MFVLFTIISFLSLTSTNCSSLPPGAVELLFTIISMIAIIYYYFTIILLLFYYYFILVVDFNELFILAPWSSWAIIYYYFYYCYYLLSFYYYLLSFYYYLLLFLGQASGRADSNSHDLFGNYYLLLFWKRSKIIVNNRK